MEVFLFLWFLISLAIFIVYKNIDAEKSVDLQYFLNDSFPDELPTT